MADNEKVIRGIKQCLMSCETDEYETQCEDCPYFDPDVMVRECKQVLLRDALALLKGKESEWLEDSDPGQEYGTTWACWRCGHSIHKPYIWNPYDSGYKYCPHCGAEMKVKLDG